VVTGDSFASMLGWENLFLCLFLTGGWKRLTEIVAIRSYRQRLIGRALIVRNRCEFNRSLQHTPEISPLVLHSLTSFSVARLTAVRLC